MFSRWGALVYRFRRPIVVVTVALAVLSLALASRTSSVLSSGGWLDPSSESAQVSDRLAREFSAGRSNLIALFRSSAVPDATSPASQGLIAQTLAGLQGDPDVAGVVGFAQTGDRRFVSTRGDAQYVLILLTLTDRAVRGRPAGAQGEDRRATGRHGADSPGMRPVTVDSAAQSEKDLQRAETLSLPVVAIILVAVFATLVGAGCRSSWQASPIPTALGLIYLAAQVTEMSIYVLNIATMLGLALAIDYSLFEVSRFREELARGRSVGDAVERAVATSGKAIAFSGIAVRDRPVRAAPLQGERHRVDRHRAVPSCVSVPCSIGLTFLPAMLGMLGPRVNSLSLRGLFDRVRVAFGRPVGTAAATAASGRWERVAHAVMRRPISVLVVVLAFLFLLGSPFLRLEQGVPDASIMPAGLESRDAYAALLAEFPKGEVSPITVLATVTGDPTSPANALSAGAVRCRTPARRRHRPGGERVQPGGSGKRHGADPGTGRGHLRGAGRPAAAGDRGAPRPVRARLHGQVRCRESAASPHHRQPPP